MRLLLAARPTLRSGMTLLTFTALAVGCASQPSLVPERQAESIQIRERALAAHTGAIQEAIRQSNALGALAFIDNANGRLVVLPGDTPGDAWARHQAAGTPVAVPPVVDFVYRPDIAKAPDTTLDTRSLLKDVTLLVRTVPAVLSAKGAY